MSRGLHDHLHVSQKDWNFHRLNHYKSLIILFLKQNSSIASRGFIILEDNSESKTVIWVFFSLQETWESMNNINDCVSQLSLFDEKDMHDTEMWFYSSKLIGTSRIKAWDGISPALHVYCKGQCFKIRSADGKTQGLVWWLAPTNFLLCNRDASDFLFAASLFSLRSEIMWLFTTDPRLHLAWVKAYRQK